MISREVELEKMRRAKPKVSEGLARKKPKTLIEAPGTSKALPNHLQRLIPKVIKPKAAQVVRSNIALSMKYVIIHRLIF